MIRYARSNDSRTNPPTTFAVPENPVVDFPFTSAIIPTVAANLFDSSISLAKLANSFHSPTKATSLRLILLNNTVVHIQVHIQYLI